MPVRQGDFPCIFRCYRELPTETDWLETGYTAGEYEQGAGPCAKGTFEPRQVRKEATVRRPSFVPQDHLAPVI